MSKDLSENYSVTKWLKEKKEIKQNPRAATILFSVNIPLFGLLGIVYFWTFWDGISEWWRITHLSWEEVKDTPYRSIWTSGRVIPAILFLLASALNALALCRHLKTQKAEPDDSGND